jgi:hypothetical protein
MLRNAKKHPFILLHAPLFIKLIDFNEKVVSDVTSETTFSSKSIYLMKREDERGIWGSKCLHQRNKDINVSHTH